MAARILSPVIFAWLGNVPKWNKAIYITRILASYEACHVTYQLHEFVASPPINNPESESISVIGWPVANSRRKFLPDRSRENRDTLQGF